MARKEKFEFSEIQEIRPSCQPSHGKPASVAGRTKQTGDTAFFLNRQEQTKKDNFVFRKLWKSEQRVRDLHFRTVGEVHLCPVLCICIHICRSVFPSVFEGV